MRKTKLYKAILLAMLSFFCLNLQIALAQETRQINGSVKDDTDIGIPGVNIIVKGTTIGTISDNEGNFILNVPDGSNTLIFSIIGFVSQEVDISGKNTLDISLKPDIAALDEVIVVGYGTQDKKDLTGSISSINTKEFENQPVNRVDQVLQGRVTGVNVTNSSGAPGGSVSIRIRGANSISGGNEPLYVIDGFVGASFADVNPNDIESIQVLKDASATAIYGSRGANGVVIITTKSGTPGQPSLSLTARFITSEVLNTWDLMDAATFAEVANLRADALGATLPFTIDQINDFRANGGTDWQDEIFRNAVGQEYQLDYSGGSEKTSYYISGNFIQQEGVLINSDFERYTFRANLKTEITSKLSADLRLTFSRRENNNTGGGGNTLNAFGNSVNWAPTTPARDEDGILTLRDPIGSLFSNPIELANNDFISISNVALLNGNFNYEIISGLTARVGFGINYSNNQNKFFVANSLTNTPSAGRFAGESVFWQTTSQLTYKKSFAGGHSVDITAVAEFQAVEGEGLSSNATGLLVPDLRFNRILLSEQGTFDGNRGGNSLSSYLGRLNYTFKDKYLFTVAIRADGSSRFRKGNRYSYFPSVALGWRVSEESFMQGVSFLDDLKLRASYGQTGNQAIGNLATFTLLNPVVTSVQNAELVTGLIIGNPGNPNLTWETTEQYNVGLDLQVMGGRVGFTVDYFVKNTTDLLLGRALPASAGGGFITENVGEVKNDGIELSLNATVLDMKEIGFSWSSSFNISFLNNEVIDLGQDEQLFRDGGLGAGATQLSEMILRPGLPLATFYGLKYLGVWQSNEADQAALFGNVPGDSKYEDVNGDQIIDGNDFQPIGSSIPTTLWGFNNTFSYKGFTLNVFFQAMMGHQRWNFSYGNAILPGREITHSDILNRWVEGTNEGSNIPAFSPTNRNFLQSSRFVESGNFIRLKNISLSYNLPKNTIKGIDASFMVAANNLWTITDYRGIDPEAFTNNGNLGDALGIDAGAYPNAKTWTFGIQVKL